MRKFIFIAVKGSSFALFHFYYLCSCTPDKPESVSAARQQLTFLWPYDTRVQMKICIVFALQEIKKFSVLFIYKINFDV